MRLRRRVTSMSLFALGAVVLSGSLGSGTGLAAAPDDPGLTLPITLPAQLPVELPVEVPGVTAPVEVPAAPTESTQSAESAATAVTTPDQAPVAVAPEEQPAVSTLPEQLRPEIIAHRGDRSSAAENTPPAIAAAFANGADAVEFDVVSTSDGKAVALHDPDLRKHTSNCTGLASQLTYAQIRKCRIRGGGGQVPNLDEMLREVYAGKRAYVHLKTPAGRGMAPRLLAAVDQYGQNADGRIVFFSSSPKVLNELRAAGAEIVGLIFDDAEADAAWSSDFPVLIPYQTPVTKSLVGAAHRRGQQVVPVQARPTTAAQALKLGVDGFMADNLTGVLKILG